MRSALCRLFVVDQARRTPRRSCRRRPPRPQRRKARDRPAAPSRLGAGRASAIGAARTAAQATRHAGTRILHDAAHRNVRRKSHGHDCSRAQPSLAAILAAIMTTGFDARLRSALNSIARIFRLDRHSNGSSVCCSARSRCRRWPGGSRCPTRPFSPSAACCWPSCRQDRPGRWSRVWRWRCSSRRCCSMPPIDTSLRDLRDNWVPVSTLVFVAVGVTTAAVACWRTGWCRTCHGRPRSRSAPSSRRRMPRRPPPSCARSTCPTAC